MFLNLLNQNEGKNFLELAKLAMDAGEKIEETEIHVFNTFKIELGLQDYKIKNKSYNELMTGFQGSTKKVKRAVIIELAGVLDADEEIDQNEQKWIKKLGDDWGFRDSELKKMVRWTQDFNDLLQEGYQYINKR